METITLDAGTKERLSKALDLIIESQVRFHRQECTCVLDVGSFVRSTRAEQIRTLKSLEYHSKQRKIGAIDKDEIDRLRSLMKADLAKQSGYVW